MIIEFHDGSGRSDHDAFVEWRTLHCCDEDGENEREGYFLTIQKINQAELHTWDCRQSSAGGLNWDGFFGSQPTLPPSLTKVRKICADDQAELLAWCLSHGIEVVPCKHCMNQLQGLADGGSVASFETLRAIEGIARETTITSRGRSEPLRRAALARAGGICEACGMDYSALAGGLGLRVLQVHHRQQLSLVEEPTVNGLDDLAVVCANCHLMIHADVSRAIPVEELRRRLAWRDAS